MQPHIRRIIAVDAHRRRTGRCPAMIHALGSGDSFDIAPTTHGFMDVVSGIRVQVAEGHILLPFYTTPIKIILAGDIDFAGFEPASGERFSGRAGGGSSVTIYDSRQDHYFQYAVVNNEGDQP